MYTVKEDRSINHLTIYKYTGVGMTPWAFAIYHLLNIDKTQQYILLGAESSIGEKKLVTHDGRRLIEISHIRYYNMTSYSHIIRKYMRKKCIIFFIVLKKKPSKKPYSILFKKPDILQEKKSSKTYHIL